MLASQLVGLAMVTMTVHVASTQHDHQRQQQQQDSQSLSRLDRLERAVGGIQSERLQWQKEKKELKKALHDAKSLTGTLVEALARTEALAKTLAAENEGLKSEVRDLSEQLDGAQALMESVAVESEVLKAQLGAVQRELASAVKRGGDGENIPGGVDQSSTENFTDTLKKKKNNLHFSKKTAPHHHAYSSGLWQQDSPSRAATPPTETEEEEAFSRHVLAARSDDLGALDSSVNAVAQQLTGLTAEVQALRTCCTHTDSRLGSSYVHWGSSTCPQSADLVYTGVIGGSHQDHAGAASNPLCLTLAPGHMHNVQPGILYTFIYGAEYETYDSHQNKDPVCAVCLTPHTATITVPGTDTCPSGWSLQYSGFLMAGYWSHPASSQYICVDSALESRMDSQTNNVGHLLYYTKTMCGSLPCDPYQNGQVMICSVCSK